MNSRVDVYYVSVSGGSLIYTVYGSTAVAWAIRASVSSLLNGCESSRTLTKNAFISDV